jgi:hypothetical protein
MRVTLVGIVEAECVPGNVNELDLFLDITAAAKAVYATTERIFIVPLRNLRPAIEPPSSGQKILMATGVHATEHGPGIKYYLVSR